MDIKERIQHKAKDLFHKYGIKSITMDEIASQLGASKKTIYQYFSDKDELVDAVVKDMIGYAQQLCERNAAQQKDAVHQLFNSIGIMQEMFANMNPALMYDLERFHPQSFRAFIDHKNKFLLQVIKDNLKRGIDEELYRPDIEIEILARYRLEGMMIAFNQDIFPASKFNLGELHRIIIEHFLFGVASLKGYKLILKYQSERLKS